MDTTLISIQLVGAIAQAVLIKKAKQKKKNKKKAKAYFGRSRMDNGGYDVWVLF